MTGSRLAVIALLIGCFASSTPTAESCCAVFPSGKPVVNADQSVIIIWDEANKTQHFIRRASFKSDADDFGFLVPSPTKPELDESGNEAFPALQKLTEPAHIKARKPMGTPGCGCAAPSRSLDAPMAGSSVKVLEEKTVAGYKASVLETKSVHDLVNWLKENGYFYSMEVAAWAKPYVDQGWKFTALKLVKGEPKGDAKTVDSSSLRITFKTDRPLFPYREPDSSKIAEQLATNSRLLRIYFIADSKFEGTLTPDQTWTGKIAWAGKITAEDRKRVLSQLRLPESVGPASWYLTEFEDNWAYKLMPADVYFKRASNQGDVRREPIIEYVRTKAPVDPLFGSMAMALVLLPVVSFFRRRWM